MTAATIAEQAAVDMAEKLDRAAYYRLRRDVAYAKGVAAIEIDPKGETVILPIMPTAKAMLLAKVAL